LFRLTGVLEAQKAHPRPRKALELVSDIGFEYTGRIVIFKSDTFQELPQVA
jgi:hypothetical protein